MPPPVDMINIFTQKIVEFARSDPSIDQEAIDAPLEMPVLDLQREIRNP
jgi:hypothetical protein